MLHVFCKQQYEKTFPGHTVEILLVWLFSETTASNSIYMYILPVWYIPLILVSIPPLYFIFVT